MFTLRLFTFIAGALAATASAQTIITSVPYTISSSGQYQLGANVATSSASQSAITISVPNVVLDLKGFFASGPGGTPSSLVPVINVGNVANVTIRNGIIANNGTGIKFGGGSNASNYVVENVTITSCYEYGINAANTIPGSIFRNNIISKIGGSTAISNASAFGIGGASGGMRIETNYIDTITATGAGGSYGLYVDDCSVVGNSFRNCGAAIVCGNDCKYQNNLTVNCPNPRFVGGQDAGGNN